MQKSILIFRTGQLGDTLVAMPAIHAVRKKYPEHRLILLTDKHPSQKDYVSSWDILKPTGWFDEVIFYNPDESFPDEMKNMILLVKKLRLYNPEYIFDLSQERTAWQCRRDRIFFRYLVGSEQYRSRGAFINYDKNANGTLRRIDPEWKRLLQIADLESHDSKFLLNIPDYEREKAKKILREMNIKKEKILLALGPGSKRPTTKWPTERFVELGSRLLNDFMELELMVLGGKEDIEIGEKLCVEWGDRAYNLAGKLSVYGSAAILKECLVFIGNDTGTMHLAGIVGKPCVAIFSARNYPGQWEPYGENHIILRHETECAGCKLEVCEKYENKCLKLITVDEVFEAIKEIIQKNTQILASHIKER
jgi:ADP-heptose:LPS heptosyltransferase